MEIGTVKWFNNVKGFGFISSDAVEGDIFVHYSVIQDEGYRSLKIGQKVEFEYSISDKGATATKVVPTYL